MRLKMSKYSLEAWRRYPEKRICPTLAISPAEAKFSKFRLPLKELPSRYSSVASLLPDVSRDALLMPVLTPPAWLGDDCPMVLADYFIRRLGAISNGGEGYLGVLANTLPLIPEVLPALLKAFVRGFNNCPIIFNIADVAAIREARRQGISFGLLLDINIGIINIREIFAAYNLQHIWETAPVLMETKATSGGNEAITHAASGWHVSAADISGVYPACMALRRLTFPMNLNAGGAIPLRFWWQNLGNAPLYIKSRIRMWLRGAGGEAEILLGDEEKIRPIGDDTYNEIAQLPELPAGEYELLCGLFDNRGQGLPLAIDAPCENGKYIIGRLILDEVPRPELYHAWDDYYPEGYYPLEDPKLPV
jgi:hypothetical protein